jgi:hypothetical protein
MRYVILVILLSGCSALSDFDGYSFGQPGAAGGAAGSYVPYQDYAGSAGQDQAGAGGQVDLGGAGQDQAGEGGQAGIGGAGGEIEPLAGAGGEPQVDPEPDAGIEPEPDAGEPDAGPESDAGSWMPKTTQCQPCPKIDCNDGILREHASCSSLALDGSYPMFCLITSTTGTCPYDGLVFRGACSSVGCFGDCVPESGDCEAWLQAR